MYARRLCTVLKCGKATMVDFSIQQVSSVPKTMVLNCSTLHVKIVVSRRIVQSVDAQMRRYDNFQIDKKQREKDWNKYRTELCKLFKDSGGGACTDAFANALSLENMEAPWQTEHEKALALALANAQANGKSKGP